VEFEHPAAPISPALPAPTGIEKQQGNPLGPRQGTPILLTRFEAWIGRLTLLRVLILLALISLVLRVFYAGYLFQDDGLWFTAAEQILRGKALYREIYFDKPPALPLLYSLLFKAFGAHILVIRLFTVAWATSVSAILYFFASSLYGRKTGILAAALFTFFSTTGVSGHVQGLNTDFLMVLPYTIGAFALTAARSGSGFPRSMRSHALLAFAGGGLTGVAVQTNPKGIFNLAFFAALLAVEYLVDRGHAKRGEAGNRLKPADAVMLFAIAAGGVLVGSLPFLAGLAASHSLSAYTAYVWAWGFKYARYFPLAQSLATGVRVISSYLALNSILAITVGVFLARLVKGIARRNAEKPNRDGAPQPGEAESMSAPNTSEGVMASGVQARSNSHPAVLRPRAEFELMEPDIILAMWLACSFAAITIGGRFYSHYLFEVLPALCLASARGLIYLKQWTRLPAVSRRHRFTRRIIVSALVIGLAVTIVRFHTRTAVLALDWARGRKSESTGRWFHEVLNREERMAAALVDELPGGPEEAMSLPPEAIRSLRRADGQMPGPSDYLFVWGYRPEVYYWSGLIPASRFISIQPITGVPADVQYINGNSLSILSDSARQVALNQLLSDLEETRPKYVVDEVGMFNSALQITSYPGIADFMRDYKQVEPTGRLMVYRRRDPSKKKRLSDSQ
jgi:hypothetical protein